MSWCHWKKNWPEGWFDKSALWKVAFGKKTWRPNTFAGIAGVGLIKRNVIAHTKPDITVEVDGDSYTVTTHTTLKTIKIAFTLGQEYEADPGTDRVAKVIIQPFWSHTVADQLGHRLLI